MNENITTLERPAESTFGEPASALNHDDDEVLDQWLASLTPGELDHFLGSLANTQLDLPYALQPTA